MSEYLYGAAVQGIQGFIYQTNKLREIVGASELVERICTDLFASVLYAGSAESREPDPEKRRKLLLKKLEGDEKAIMNAAGNIKYLFSSEEECKRVVRVFPKTVMEFAPGITISQSVVEMTGDANFKDAVQQLERNLRTQRSRQMRDLSMGLMGILRSRDTALPVTHIRKNGKITEYLDSATFHKLFDENNRRKETFTILCRKAFGPDFDLHDKKLPHDIKDMTGGNDWIAIIHADGNGLGQIVQKIGTDRKLFCDFSRNLDAATTTAAVCAFNDVVVKEIGEDDMIPMRPIVLSGDDLTVICRADIALSFTEAFLKYFEDETGKRLGDLLKRNGNHVFSDRSLKLTACAGIAFIKSSFPFHFGYRLAEALCDRAKKDSKSLFRADEGNLPASCLMFHKVQDSFVADFNDIAERELTPQTNVSLEYGPYYLDTDSNILKGNRWSIETLIKNADKLNGEAGNAVKSGLRNWLTQLHDNEGLAAQRLSRLVDVSSASMKDFIESVAKDSVGSYVRKTTKKGSEGKDFDVTIYPVYDLLAIHTINNQNTKK
ncbi:MAG: hypothetical protein K2G77_03310 [Muribaculaceae bacterium]|nr:hypothetical protein [Muribaculaceae bacterium]